MFFFNEDKQVCSIKMQLKHKNNSFTADKAIINDKSKQYFMPT